MNLIKKKHLTVGQVDESGTLLSFGKVFGYKKDVSSGAYFQLQSPFKLRRKVIHPGTFSVIEADCWIKMRISRVNSEFDFNFWYYPDLNEQEGA